MKPLYYSPKLKGDLLFVNLLGCAAWAKQYEPPKMPGQGWLLVVETSTDGEVAAGNFTPVGCVGAIRVKWPALETFALVRGHHTEAQPYAALAQIFEACAYTRVV